jgi:hypothetical protein
VDHGGNQAEMKALLYYNLLLISLSLGSLWAQPALPFDQGESLQIKLVTIDPGDEITMWWGHTAIIVEDTRSNTSVFYNYGIFSFEQENFYRNFAMGRLIFWVGAWNTAGALDYYKSLNRSIRMQILDLSPRRRWQMAQFLEQNVLPANREYLYDHYADNCATRVRDLIDNMTDGRLGSACQQPGRMTLRQHTRCHTHHHFFMDLLLMFLMNDTIDWPITRWEEMFLPTELERNILTLSIADSGGVERKLVSEDILFFESVQRPPPPDFAPKHWPVALALGGFIAMLGLYLAFLFRSGVPVSRYLYGTYNALLGIILGIPGLALFFMACFTDHTVTYHNENLFLANPLTLLLIGSGMGIIRKSRWQKGFSRAVSLILVLPALVSLLLKILPAFNQDNWDIISLVLPVLVALVFSWIRLGRES